MRGPETLVDFPKRCTPARPCPPRVPGGRRVQNSFLTPHEFLPTRLLMEAGAGLETNVMNADLIIIFPHCHDSYSLWLVD